MSFAWQADAACLDMDPAIFFPERGDREAVVLAKSVCARCPVSDPCRELGMAQSAFENFGIYGGTTFTERRNLKRQRRKAS